jgi:integrase
LASSTEIVVTPAAGDLAAGLLERARAYAADARADATKRAYSGDWRRFVQWCQCPEHGFSPLPPDPKVRCAYATWLADGGSRGRPYPLTTIRRALTSIAIASRALGHAYPQSDPDVTDTLHGIARRLGDRPKKKRALMIEMLVRVLSDHRSDLLGARDKCMLSLGWFFASRRSELAGVDVEHIEFIDTPPSPQSIGIRLLIPRSKVDPTGKGRVVGIPFTADPRVCPVRLTRAWIEASGTTHGPLFRSVTKGGKLAADRLDPGSIARVIKRIVKAHGFNYREFAGHSLRRGFVTSAARAMKPLDAICRTTGHSKKSTRILLEYIEEAAMMDGQSNAGAGLA